MPTLDGGDSAYSFGHIARLIGYPTAVPKNPFLHSMGQSAIAAGHESTLESAEEILRLGGNAFDAAISSLEHREVRIRAFPNPTDSKVMVESDQLGTEEIRLLDHIGRDLSGLVEVMRMSDTQVQLDMVRLPAGVYLLSVGTSSLRILRQ